MVIPPQPDSLRRSLDNPDSLVSAASFTGWYHVIERGRQLQVRSYTKSQIWPNNSDPMVQLLQTNLRSRLSYNPTVYMNLLRYFIDQHLFFLPHSRWRPRLTLGVVIVTSLFVQRRNDEGRSLWQVSSAEYTTTVVPLHVSLCWCSLVCLNSSSILDNTG